jgi:U6 snRNA-associated Sm-like protein LSm7
MNKEKKVQLLSDLGRFKGKRVTITFVDGRSITGRLVSHDEIANCVLEKCGSWEYGRNVVCMGRAIVLVSMNAPHVL